MLTPDEIASRQFLVSLRGYDRDEVDRFLEQAADTVAALQRQVRELEDAVAAETSRVPAQREASPVPTSSAPAQVSPQEAFKALGEETTRILVAAEESARSIKQKAEERAQQELETARREARDEVESARRTASKVVADAERRRNQIAEDARSLEALRDRMADQLREAVRTTTGAMRGLAPANSDASQDEQRSLPRGEPRAASHNREGRTPPSADDEDSGAVAAPPRDVTRPEPSSETATAPPAGGRGSLRDAESVDEPDATDDLWEPAPSESEASTTPAPTHVFDDLGVDEEPAPEAGPPPAPEPEPVPEAEPEPVAETEPEPEAVVETEPEPEQEPEPASEEALTPAAATVDSRQQREQSLAAIRPGLLRRVKRALQDVQNDVLDRLRRSGDTPELEGLLPDTEAMAVLNAAGEQFLSDSYTVGLADGALLADRELPEDAADPSRVPARAATFAAVISHEVTAALRATLRAGIEAGEASASLSERIGEVFRDLKGPVAEVTVDEHLSRTYGYGTLDAWSALGITAKEWVPGIAPRCPEEMRGQNADAGACELGAEFPTGQVVPPAHDGCDCTLIPR